MGVHMKTQNFIRGALIVSVGGIAAKILGAFYRIPLTNLLGGEGIGIYQMVYPLYCLLLTVSATGIPSGLARLVSQAQASGSRLGMRAVLRKSLTLFSVIGLVGTAVMFLFAPLMSAAQNEPLAVNAYRALAPSVFLVSVLSCFRGYYQGQSNFVPTAVSEVVEQVVKIAFGLYFAYQYRSNTVTAVVFTLLSVTVSECAATVFMLAAALRQKQVRPLYRDRAMLPRAAALLRVTIPVTIAAGVLPLSNMIDSILIVNLVGRYSDSATALYGLYAGAATTLINLPVSVCYGLAAASIPLVSSLTENGEAEKAEKKCAFALKCTLFLALPAAVFLFAFSLPVAQTVFPSVKGEQGIVLSGLVRGLSSSCVLLALVQTLSACLTGSGRAKISAISMTAAVAVKLILEFFLLRVPQISIFGAAYASAACYLVAFGINLVYSIKDRKNRRRFYGTIFKFGAFSLAAVLAAVPFGRINIFAALAVAALVYCSLSVAFCAFSEEELGLVRRKKKYDQYRRLRV